MEVRGDGTPPASIKSTFHSFTWYGWHWNFKIYYHELFWFWILKDLRRSFTSESLAASTLPAAPPPTTMKSKLWWLEILVKKLNKCSDDNEMWNLIKATSVGWIGWMGWIMFGWIIEHFTIQLVVTVISIICTLGPPQGGMRNTLPSRRKMQLLRLQWGPR